MHILGFLVVTLSLGTGSYFDPPLTLRTLEEVPNRLRSLLWLLARGTRSLLWACVFRADSACSCPQTPLFRASGKGHDK